MPETKTPEATIERASGPRPEKSELREFFIIILILIAEGILLKKNEHISDDTRFQC